MTAIPINQLARPKNAKYECEVCGKPASLRCSECPTYYCTEEHFDIDWRGIRNFIAQDIVILRERPKMIGSEEERDKRAEELMGIRKELLELCTYHAKKFLVQGDNDLAVPGALQSLKFAIEIYGNESTELVPSYLLLAEANLGLAATEKKNLGIAEEFLSLANWNILKHPEAGSSMNSNLQRNFGRLYQAQHRYDDALKAFATDIYHSSLVHGPEHLRSAPSYYYMGRVFQSNEAADRAAEAADRAAHFYTKVVQIYAGSMESLLGESGTHDTSDITAVEIEEATEIIKHITEVREKRLHEEDQVDRAEEARRMVAEAKYALGLLLVYNGKKGPGKESLEEAFDVFRSTPGVDDEKLQRCGGYIDILDKQLQRELLLQDAVA